MLLSGRLIVSGRNGLLGGRTQEEEPGVEKAGSIFNETWSEGVLVEGSQEEITNEPQLAFYKNGRPNKASVDSWIEMKVK